MQGVFVAIVAVIDGDERREAADGDKSADGDGPVEEDVLSLLPLYVLGILIIFAAPVITPTGTADFLPVLVVPVLISKSSSSSSSSSTSTSLYSISSPLPHTSASSSA